MRPAPPYRTNTALVFIASGGTIGGTTAAANVISGNSDDGVYIDAPCLMEGNEIGTNAAGSAVPNGDGINVGGSGGTIGGTTTGDANVISGNSGYGVKIDASCLVVGNDIGTNASGTAVPNEFGIGVFGSGGTIGGTTTAAANVIAGNSEFGVLIDAACLVEGNDDRDECVRLRRTERRRHLCWPLGRDDRRDDDRRRQCHRRELGLRRLHQRACLFEGNEIGTNASGTAVPNLYGIGVGGSGGTIGGTTTGDANVISGNTVYGVYIQAACLVEGNDIGTDSTGNNPIPNGSGGIFVDTSNATIGGSAGTGNVIAFNQGAGVATAPGTTGTTIRFNAIFSNAGPGIDRNDDGVTPNTPGGTYNTPVLASIDNGIITGTLNAAPNSTYVIDFYANLPSDDTPTRPQGRDDLTSTTVTTNAAGDAVFNVAYTPFPGLPILTATATAADGTTSEFSPPLGFAVTASGTTFAATTGVAFQGTVASIVTTDPSATAADFTATINWGDGSASSTGTVVAGPGGFVVIGSHTYTTANPVTPVTVTIGNTIGAAPATAGSLADVTTPGGIITTFGTSPSFVAGTLTSAVVASFTDSDPATIPGQFTATINWGDGSASSAGVVSVAGAGFEVTGSHTYSTPASDPIVVTIKDSVSGVTVTADSTAQVAAQSYTLSASGLTFAATTGVAFQGTVASFTSTDPSATSSTSPPRSTGATAPPAPPVRSWRPPAGSSSSARTPTRRQTPSRRSR